jgi:hypothetical protein
MNRYMAWIASALFGSALLPSPGGAITIGFAPPTIDATAGDVIVLDIVVSDLQGEIVSAYDLDLTYSASVLTATSLSFGSLLGTGAQVLQSADLSAPGVVDLAQLSLLSDASLLALQGGDTFVLATVGFEVTGEGTSPLGFSFDAFNDIKGINAQELAVTVAAGAVDAASGVAPIPEPTGALLFGLGTFIACRRTLTRPSR